MFRLFRVCFTSFWLIAAYCGFLCVVTHFIKPVKAHKACQNLETLKKWKVRKAHKKMRTSKVRKKVKALKARKKKEGT